ncbi:MAG TPA: class I SAM-dependent methyltransferase [Rhizobiales bacterium]|nr:class I SAM-dependent methyltransferase [Hyphomicrobiales bacterium]
MNAENPDTLEAEIRHRIALNGPLNLARYMSICLSHAEHGYYMTRDPLGALGDFTTAPEISQIFGELIGLWCAHIWQSMNAPKRLHLVELGPGRGTLMSDALRAIRSAAPPFMAALDVHLVETSPVLRQKQARKLQGSGLDPYWHHKIEQIPPGPAIFIANEFLDALPIHQYQRTPRGWCERLVTLRKEGGFAYGLSPVAARDKDFPEALRGAPEGSIFEISPAREAVIKTIAERLSRQAGAALIIDYGHAKTAPGDSFQAVRNHEFTDPLENPGQADLTSHVDFETLSRIARSSGAAVHGPITQNTFLSALGLAPRASRLKSRADARTAREIDEAVNRLISPDQMGDLFKVLCLTSTTPHPPFPFA